MSHTYRLVNRRENCSVRVVCSIHRLSEFYKLLCPHISKIWNIVVRASPTHSLPGTHSKMSQHFPGMFSAADCSFLVYFAGHTTSLHLVWSHSHRPGILQQLKISGGYLTGHWAALSQSLRHI